MGSMYVGTTGLQTSQNALNTTAHNMANVDTSGYTRQQVLLSDKIYNTVSYNAPGVSLQQVGLGVNYSATLQVRDVFLDATYRKESGRSSFYEASHGTLEEVENLLGELNGTAFQESLNDLWISIQELSKTPESSVTQGILVQRASEFLERSKAVYTGLSDYQNNLNLQVKSQVDQINEYGHQIRLYNEQIRKIETAGVEKANDIRDKRNLILDKLGGMVNMSYSEDLYGSINVYIEGEPFVTCDTVFEMALQHDEITGFDTPFWPQNATFVYDTAGKKIYDSTDAEVYDFSQRISSEIDTDIGSLKGLILARGDHRATFADLTDEVHYDNDVSQSILMNIQAEFDQLIHNVTTKINDVLAAASDSATGYLCNKDGSPMQLFEKLATKGYTYNTVTSTWDYMPEDISNLNSTETLYSIMNMRINTDLQNNPASLGFVKNDGSVDQETADKLKNIFNEQSYILNPNVTTKNNFMDYYSSLVAQVGNSASVYKSIMENQKATVSATDSARQGVLAVSTDEELSNMIRFQNAYNASSRYITTISEMLEHIINTLGV